jgi:hypothetical protein
LDLEVVELGLDPRQLFVEFFQARLQRSICPPEAVSANLLIQVEAVRPFQFLENPPPFCLEVVEELCAFRDLLVCLSQVLSQLLR